MAYGQKPYTLMHKDIAVADMTIDEATGGIVRVTALHAPAHIPVGVGIVKNSLDRRALNDWWKGRSIPASRLGLKEALLGLGVAHTELLLEKCLGLSLSDQYWIRPLGSTISWSEVNFFDNPFSEDVGQILFGQRTSGDCVSLMSPDNTSDGWLRKKWLIIDGKRYLLKSGSGATQQEPYNEVLASCLMERLHIPHVPYRLVMQDGYPYSLCEDFITAQTELISAWHILQTRKRPNHVSLYQHYVDCAKELGIPGVVPALDQMLVVDYLIANEDRHLNNFGEMCIRDRRGAVVGLVDGHELVAQGCGNVAAGEAAAHQDGLGLVLFT